MATAPAVRVPAVGVPRRSWRLAVGAHEPPSTANDCFAAVPLPPPHRSPQAPCWRICARARERGDLVRATSARSDRNPALRFPSCPLFQLARGDARCSDDSRAGRHYTGSCQGLLCSGSSLFALDARRLLRASEKSAFSTTPGFRASADPSPRRSASAVGAAARRRDRRSALAPSTAEGCARVPCA